MSRFVPRARMCGWEGSDVNHSTRGAALGTRIVGSGVAIIAAVLLSGIDAHAQATGEAAAAMPTSVKLSGFTQSAWSARGGEDRARWAAPGSPTWEPQPNPAASVTGGHRSASRKVLGGVIGAVAGFFAGFYLGAAIEGQGCGCDDPGLRGGMIGAPIGTAFGAVLGVKLL